VTVKRAATACGQDDEGDTRSLLCLTQTKYIELSVLTNGEFFFNALDGTVPLTELFRRIDDSYRLAKKSNTKTS